jgi:hypothetical protein
MFLKGTFHQPDHRRAHLQPTVLAGVDPKVDAQVDCRPPQTVRQHRGLGIVQNGRVVHQDLSCNFLSLVDRIVVADADDKLLAPVGVGSEVAEGALVNAGVGDLHEISIEGHQDRGAHVQLLHIPAHAGNLDQVAGFERRLHAEEDARQEILGDVPEGDTNDQADQTGAAYQRQGQLRQAGDSQNEIDATDDNESARRTRDHILQEFGPNPRA